MNIHAITLIKTAHILIIWEMAAGIPNKKYHHQDDQRHHGRYRQMTQKKIGCVLRDLSMASCWHAQLVDSTRQGVP